MNLGRFAALGLILMANADSEPDRRRHSIIDAVPTLIRRSSLKARAILPPTKSPPAMGSKINREGIPNPIPRSMDAP